MKNIEKYEQTKDAVKAWDEYHDVGGDMPFAAWAEQEYIDTSVTTLLAAAKEAIKEWHSPGIELDTFARCIDRLSEIVKREKAKPIRNFDKYKTAEDAFYGFREMCFTNGVNECKDCRFNNVKEFGMCVFAYLYAEAEKAR